MGNRSLAHVSAQASHFRGSGYVCVIVAATLWAASGTASKFLFRNGVTPFELVQLRTTISAVSLFAWLLVMKRPLLKIKGGDLGHFLLLGAILAAAQFTYLYTISRIPVAAAILLQYQAPVIIALYAILFRRERVSVITIVAIIGAITGCYLMVGAYRFDMLTINGAGIITGLASALTFALYTIRSEDGMRTHAPWTVVFFALLFASLFWNILHRPLEAFSQTYSSLSWWLIMFIGLLGTVLPFGLYNKGISLIRSTRASITATLEPVMAGLISYLLLDETMETWQVTGGVVVIVSVLLLQIRKNVSDNGLGISEEGSAE